MKCLISLRVYWIKFFLIYNYLRVWDCISIFMCMRLWVRVCVCLLLGLYLHKHIYWYTPCRLGGKNWLSSTKLIRSFRLDAFPTLLQIFHVNCRHLKIAVKLDYRRFTLFCVYCIKYCSLSKYSYLFINLFVVEKIFVSYCKNYKWFGWSFISSPGL